MESVYSLCLIVGLALSVISFLSSMIGDAADSVVDALCMQFDIPGTDIALFPVSSVALCMTAILFGGTGKMMTIAGFNGAVTVASAAGAGLAGGILMQNLIKFLKKHGIQKETMVDDSMSATGTVILKIPGDGLGTVSIRSKGSKHSYRARSSDGESIEQGTDVTVLSIEDGVAIVSELV